MKADRSYTIVPPEGVPLTFRLAGIGARLGAQMTDLAVTIVAAILLFFAIGALVDISASALFALVGLVFFLLRTPYYVVTELAWNGRTLTKRWIGLRTISRDGRSLRAYQIVVRNLMREIEFFTPLLYVVAGSAAERLLALGWIVVVTAVMTRSKHNQRLGDLIAGTIVIEEPKVALLSDVSQEAKVGANAGADERFTFTTAQLDAYGAYELQVLERLLRRLPANASADATRNRTGTLAEVVARIRAKIAYVDPVDPREHEAFLQAFYTAQRGYLESRKLFGDDRANKAYREREDI